MTSIFLKILGLSTSMIRGGIKVTDPTHYPWFAFLRIGLPDIEWIIVDPKTGTGRYYESKICLKIGTANS